MKSHCVIPEVKPRALPEDHRPSFLGHVLGYAFLTYMAVAMLVLPTRGPDGMPLALLAGAFVGGPVGFGICWVRLVGAREKYAIDFAAKEASEISREANELLVRCQTAEQRLKQALISADGWICHAQHEYNERAYDPFWEAIERSAGNLAIADASARLLSVSSRKYQSLLHGRQHDFPSQPIRSPIPDPTRTVREFRAIVRKGQTDFKFATIWQQRATRMAVIEGFGSVGEAVNGIATRVSEGLAGLRSEISAELREIADGQQGTLTVLEQHDRKLDNLLDRRSGGRLW